jgi:threonine synthase
MKYISTRGDRTERGFSEILLEGLAPDGGLYLPISYPKVDASTLERWRALSYADLAFEILSLYIDDIPAADLKRLVKPCPTAPLWPSRTWPCSCWARCSSTSWRDVGRP